MKSISFGSFLISLVLSGCGQLPRPRLFEGSIGQLPVSFGASGLVLTSTDASYSSSEIYFFDFATGVLRVLANGESGDVLTRWQADRLWVFNRSVGRVSYSHMSPKVGSASRSVERRTVSGSAGDPSDILALSTGEFALGLGSAHKVIVANFFTSGSPSSELGVVDTGDSLVPFRPGVLASMDSDLLVFHQQLSENWKAAGSGRLFIARSSGNGSWNWVDQNPTVPSVQGILLNISNPVAAFACRDLKCQIAGACYETMGAACISGVDEFDASTKTVRHIFDMPADFYAAGPMKRGASTQTLIACLKSKNKTNAELVAISTPSGVIEGSWDAGAAFCGPFQIDESASRIFVIKSAGNSSELHVLNSNLATVSTISLPFIVSGLEIVDE